MRDDDQRRAPEGTQALRRFAERQELSAEQAGVGGHERFEVGEQARCELRGAAARRRWPREERIGHRPQVCSQIGSRGTWQERLTLRPVGARRRRMTAVKGFRFSGVSAGIKKKVGALDLGLIVADEPVPVAAVFTRNLVRAQPVHVSEQRILRHKKAQVCLVNSGNANACTGPAGLEAALNTTAAVGQALGISAEYVLPSSTGVIGQVLPEGKVIAALPALVSGLSEEAATFAEAIMTTDRFAKIETATIQGDAPRGMTAQVLAIGKGAGMFHPDLALAGELPQPDGGGYETGGDLSGLHATMLVYILTDAKANA